MKVPITLQNLVKACWVDFVNEWQIKDYPMLYDVFAIISTESSWDVEANSGYARGLMQLSPSAVETINNLYKKNYTYDNMFRPDANIWVGIRYLRWLWRAFEGWSNRKMLTLMAYNWGIKNVLNWLSCEKTSNTYIDEAVPKETKGYLVSYIFWTEWWRYKLPGSGDK